MLLFKLLIVGGAVAHGMSFKGNENSKQALLLLLNHTSTINAVQTHIELLNNVSFTGLPYILGEMNSLSGQGRPGLSDCFGATLWGIDFNLNCSSSGIKRTHMHQGTNYRYNSFQPVETNRTAKGTKAPYYGNIFVAAFLGNLTASRSMPVHVVRISLGKDPHQAAYAAYVGDKLAKIAVINMHEYNSTGNGFVSDTPILAKQLTRTYNFQVAGDYRELVSVKRLVANGSDAITGISWDGWSYNYELDNGRPVKLRNVTVGEAAFMRHGRVEVEVQDSSAVVLEFVQLPKKNWRH